MSIAHLYIKNDAVCVGLNVSSACPSDKNSINRNMIMGRWWNKFDIKKRKYWRRNLSRVTSSIINFTWNELETNTGHRGERSAGKYLNHGTTLRIKTNFYFIQRFSLY